jgi:hypothetical protein
MGSIACSDGHEISWVSNQVGLGREDSIGIQTLVRGRGQSASAHIGPEFSRPQNDGGGNRVVSKAARKCIQPRQSYADASPDQLTANLIMSDFGEDHQNSGQPKPIQPGSANITPRVSRSAARQP